MKRVLVALALLAPGPAQVEAHLVAARLPAQPSGLCVPRPPRTTPHGLFERVRRWEHDQRTIA